MDIIEKTSGSVTIVSLKGRLDTTTAPEVDSRLLQMFQEGKKYMILDFSGVTYLASAGMRVLLILAKRIKGLAGRLMLTALLPTLHDVLSITGFLPYFEIYETVEKAVEVMKT
ncbi:MAG: STAS domain-containing protein [Candidatus Omnitrophica bacterium]|nr:STAS domain-containing protein [Candidatus Omnitrophota bacterium]